MTIKVENNTSAPVAPVPGSAPVTWWRRPWIIPLTVAIGCYLAYQLSPFVGTDPTQAPVPPHAGFPEYYWILVAHMTCGTTALGLVIFQVWPWFRRNHAKAHRVMGRIYFGAVIVVGLCGLSIVKFAPPVGQIGVVFTTLALMFTATAGWFAARRHKYVAHRRWMLYSFALVTNNIWGVSIVWVLDHIWPNIQVSYLLEAARWIGWVVNLMLVQAWLYHTEHRPLDLPRRRRSRPAAVAVPAAAPAPAVAEAADAQL